MNLKDNEAGIYARLMTNLESFERFKISIIPATKFTYLIKSNNTYFEIYKKKFLREKADTRYDLRVSISKQGYMTIQLLIPKKYFRFSN